MKKKVLLASAVVMALLLNSCTAPDRGEGTFAISFPLAHLSSWGYDITKAHLTLTYNASSPPTVVETDLTIDAANEEATGTVENLRPGLWDIRIDLYEGNTVVATGTGSAEVVANQTVQVTIYATLSSGAIQITVKWGRLSISSWTTVADYPRFAMYMTAEAVNGKIYGFGGTDNSTSTDEIYEYNPATNTWTLRSHMSVPRCMMSSAVVGGKVYLFGGHVSGTDYSNMVEEYDPVANTITLKTPMPTARRLSGAAVVNGIVYVVGGLEAPSTILSVVEAYNPATDSWSTKASLPSGREYLGCASVGDKVYAFGGATNSQIFDTAWAYDTGANAWSSIASMPLTRSNFRAVTAAGRIYIAGGERPSPSWPVASYEYEPVGNTYTAITPIPMGRGRGSAAILNGSIYLIGGEDSSSQATKVVHRSVP